MGTKNNPAACDCYAKAEPDEPIFVLLARDRHAPALVWLWAVLRELENEPKEHVAEARNCCANMLAWAMDHGRKSAGVGASVLAGVLELIRTANYAVAKNAPNVPTGEEFMRLVLAYTPFQAAPPSDPPAESENKS